MIQHLSILVATAALTVAYPSLEGAQNIHARASNQDGTGNSYSPPLPNDSRGPCPLLNTIANHGFINRNGRNLEKDDISAGILAAVNMANSTIATALTNAFIVCEYVTGASCGTTLPNLTLLAEPHTFEHDHSFSRQDYKMAYITDFDNEFVDNLSFNQSIFDTTLEPVKAKTHINFADAQFIRLQLERDSLLRDYPGWFSENIPVGEFEFALIFSVMGDFNLRGYDIGEISIRKEWWQYWFANESLPYDLGWHKPGIPREDDFVNSVSSRILHASLSSTPSPIPVGATSSQPPPAALPADPTIVYPLPSVPPYVGPIGGGLATPQDRVQIAAVESTDEAFRPTRTLEPAETQHAAPYFRKNPYVDRLQLSDIAKQQAWASSRASVVRAAIVTAHTSIDQEE